MGCGREGLVFRVLGWVVELMGGGLWEGGGERGVWGARFVTRDESMRVIVMGRSSRLLSFFFFFLFFFLDSSPFLLSHILQMGSICGNCLSGNSLYTLAGRNCGRVKDTVEQKKSPGVLQAVIGLIPLLVLLSSR